jgi:iron complex outermembrane receptor protein
MQQTNTRSQKFPTRLTLIAMAVLSMSSAYAQNAPQEITNATQVTITGSKLGMGLMVQEDAPKARSTITAEELSKQRSTGNPFQALELLPSVNSYNHDATGLFGGGLTLRGFNSDQVGATINGVPVNDSGSFSVFPQEYVDQENVCSEFVTQGSTDVDSPQVGASGGNFGIVTCQPSKTRNFRVAQTLGSLNLTRTYMRFDSGIVGATKTGFFVSASHTTADKWKGEGGAKRDHIDVGFSTEFDKFNYIHGEILYNKAVNNNINSISLSDINNFGYYYDFASTFGGHAPARAGLADTDANPSPTYYKLAINPFEDVIASVTAKFRIGENTDLKVLPYFWYGFGTGGVQNQLKTESKSFYNSATGKADASIDLNGDGDFLDKVLVAQSSLTKTQRPGISAAVTHNWGNHQILAGFWYEKATHRQTGPGVKIDNNGNPTDQWLVNNIIVRPDGTPIESRDVLTLSTAYQFSLQDTINLMNDKLIANFGVRAPSIKRDFTNNPSESTNPISLIPYHLERTYSEILPQLGARYQIDNYNQIFTSYAKNMKAPGNFVFLPTNGNVLLVNGVPTLSSDVKAEISTNIDLGYRYQGKDYTSSVTVFQNYFKNRQATAVDPNTLVSATVNAGRVRNNGFEVELGNTPINGWTFYGSLGYINSVIGNDLLVGATATLGTTGKAFALTPQWKAGFSAQYDTGVWYARFKSKFTGTQYATLMNDQEVPKYLVSDMDFGYQFPSMTWLKKPTLRANLSNMFNTQYRNPSSNSVTNAVAYPGVTAKSVFYYLGAPRAVSVMLQGDF